MKNTILSLIVIGVFYAVSIAQPPQSFNYQAVVRDASGNILANENVAIITSILQGTFDGTEVFTETHIGTTNEHGLINLKIGSINFTDFVIIDWSGGPYFLNISVNGTDFGTSQLLSVPYALHSKTVEIINESDPEFNASLAKAISVSDTTHWGTHFSEDYNDLTNKPDSIKDFILSAGNINITDLAEPVNAQDAVTKAYVDDLEQQVSSMEDRIYELEIANGTATLTDIDGNEYPLVKIGNQIWMRENLKTSHFSNGDIIPDGTNAGDITEAIEPLYWFAYNNDLNNISTYGRLYTGWVAYDDRNVCPDGWHVPSDDEWKDLELSIGMTQQEVDGINWRGNDGGKLKETGITHWNSPNTGATNTTGFTALPAGRTQRDGQYFEIRRFCFWWASTGPVVENSRLRLLSFEGDGINRSLYNKNYGFSIRCIKD